MLRIVNSRIRDFHSLASLIYFKELYLPFRAHTAPLRYGGGSANMNISAINKQCALRQVSASNPPQRKAANRYRQVRQT